MTFRLPEDVPNLPAALRAAEPQAPKQMKELLIRAANELEDFDRVATDCIAELNEAAALRVGHMDSTSRTEEINRRIRQTITSCVQRLAALTAKNPQGERDGRRT